MLWRATRNPRRAIAHLFREARNAVYDIRGVPAIHDPRDSAKTIRAAIPGIGDRVARIEGELHPNGGQSLRDVVNDVHRIAGDNAERHDVVIAKANASMALAGEAAQVAARTEQGLLALRAELRRDHSENTGRLNALEETAQRGIVERRLLLDVLRHQHGIDLVTELYGLLQDCEACADGDCDHCEGPTRWCPHHCAWLTNEPPEEGAP